MSDLNLTALSKILSAALGHEVVLVHAEQIPGGYHADAFKAVAADGSAYFIKKYRSHDLGFEYPERKLAALSVSHRMAGRSSVGPSSIAVAVDAGNGIVPAPEIAESGAVYHIQSYGDLGESYWSRLLVRKEKSAMDGEDARELDAIISAIAEIHAVRHPSDGAARLASAYDDSLRALIGHPELTLTILHDFPADHPILPLDEQAAHLGRMVKLMQAWKGRGDRLRAIHGDFWGANLFIGPDGAARLVDHSRIPWGDPGIDVAWWIAQYIWFFHETGNPYFRDLAEAFLGRYETTTGDTEIRRALILTLGTLVPIYLSPRFYPGLDIAVGTRFYAHVRSILSEGRFAWT
jgi:hypothetical protein